MQHFLHTVAPASGSGAVEVDHESDYVEFLLQSKTDPSVWFASYLLKVDDNVAAAVTCWDQQFDVVFQQLNDPKYGAIYVDEFRKIWPTFFSLVDATNDERYGDGALTQLVDPDDMNRKWFVAVLVSGLQTATENDGSKFTAAVDKAVDLSLAVFREAQTKLSWKLKAKIGLRGGAVGYRAGKEFAGPWEDRLRWLQTLLGQ